jgi:hypothetical protein
MGTIGLWIGNFKSYIIIIKLKSAICSLNYIDGVAIYNAKDGYSYNSLGVWNRNGIK